MRTLLLTKARGVAGYRGPSHAYWDMTFDGGAILRCERSLLSRDIIEVMLTDAVGTAAARHPNLRVTKAILRPATASVESEST